MRIKVAVATIPRGPGRKPALLGYAMWASGSCCVHYVEAANGTHAKSLAIAEHRERCMSIAATPEAEQQRTAEAQP